MTIVQQRTDITATDAVARMQAARSGLVAMAEAAYAAVPTSYSYSTLHAVYRLDTEIAETAEALVTLTPEEFDARVKALIGEAGRASKQIADDISFHQSDAMAGYVNKIERIHFVASQLRWSELVIESEPRLVAACGM